MSLDKWLNKEELKEKNSKSPTIDRKPVKKDLKITEKPQKKENTIKKYQLKCQTKKCNFQKILVKKILTNKDITCPKCKSEMQVVKTT